MEILNSKMGSLGHHVQTDCPLCVEFPLLLTKQKLGPVLIWMVPSKMLWAYLQHSIHLAEMQQPLCGKLLESLRSTTPDPFAAEVLIRPVFPAYTREDSGVWVPTEFLIGSITVGDKDSSWTKMSLQRWEMGTWAVSIASM